MQAELEQGSVFSVMGKMIVIHVIPESDLAVGELRMILCGNAYWNNVKVKTMGYIFVQ